MNQVIKALLPFCDFWGKTLTIPDYLWQSRSFLKWGLYWTKDCVQAIIYHQTLRLVVWRTGYHGLLSNKYRIYFCLAFSLWVCQKNATSSVPTVPSTKIGREVILVQRSIFKIQKKPFNLITGVLVFCLCFCFVFKPNRSKQMAALTKSSLAFSSPIAWSWGKAPDIPISL